MSNIRYDRLLWVSMPKEVKLIVFAGDAVVVGKAPTTIEVIKKIQFLRGSEERDLN